MARSGGKPVANRKIVGRCEHAFIAKSLVMACGPERSRTADLARARHDVAHMFEYAAATGRDAASTPASLNLGNRFRNDEQQLPPVVVTQTLGPCRF